MKTFAIYHKYIPKVGGIESAVYNLARQLDGEGYKVTIYYEGCENYESVFRYAKVSDVIKLYDGQGDDIFSEEILLLGSNHRKPTQVIANRYLQWVHSDYDKYKLDLVNKDLDVEYIAVSKHAKKVIERREGIKAKVIYNLIDPDFGVDDRPILRLVTNSRVSPEKGFGRMLTFAEKLKERNIRFVWTVYGDNSHYPQQYFDWMSKFRHIQEVHWVGYKDDVTIGLTDAHFLIQLSDFEGCPLAVLEAHKMGVPVIVTNWGGVDEIVTDGVDGYIMDMDLKDIDQVIDKIIDKKLTFKPKVHSDIGDWIKIIQDKHEKTRSTKA